MLVSLHKLTKQNADRSLLLPDSKKTQHKYTVLKSFSGFETFPNTYNTSPHQPPTVCVEVEIRVTWLGKKLRN